MQVGIRENTKKVNERIVEAYFEGGGSYATLSSDFGRSESTIKKIIAGYKLAYERENGVPRGRTVKPKDPRLMTEKRSLSFRHFAIGLAVTNYMQHHRLSPTAFGMLIGKSRVQVGNITVGAHDFTLMEVERLAEVIGIDVEKLLMPPQKEAKIYAVG